MRVIRPLLFIALTFATTTSAFAATPAAHARAQHQQQRIHQGVHSGELTRVETARLEAQQHRIRVHQRQIHADGVVTNAERYRLHQQQDRANRAIYRQKHDAQERSN